MYSTHKYHCPECDFLDEMKLLKAKQGVWKDNYFYTCKSNNCKFYLNTNLSTNLNISNYSASGDFSGQIIDELNISNIHESTESINVIKILMPDLLAHIVGCRWGGHQTYIIREMIIPYLNDLDILKFVLKYAQITYAGDNILHKGYLENNEYRMNNFLHLVLLKVKSEKIHNFIIDEFGDIKDDDLSHHMEIESKHLKI